LFGGIIDQAHQLYTSLVSEYDSITTVADVKEFLIRTETFTTMAIKFKISGLPDIVELTFCISILPD